MDEDQATVLILSVVVFLVLLGITIIAPALPAYAQELEATEFMVGIVVAAYAGARVAFDIPAGVLGDRHGQKRIMSYGLVAIAVSSVFAGFAINYWMLVAVRITEGVGSAMYVTSSTALLVHAAPDEKRGQYMSYYVSALLLGAVLGPAIGGYLAFLYGLAAPFFFYALVAAVGFVLLQFFLRDAPEERSGTPVSTRDIVRLLRNPSFVLVNLGVLAAFFVRGGFNNTLFPIWAQAKFGVTTAVIGALLTLAAFTALSTMLPSGRLADRYGRKGPFVTGLLVSAVALPFVFFSDSLVGLTVTMGLYGAALGFHGPLAAWAADLAPKDRLGTAMGVYRTIGDLGWLLGPLVLTGVSDLTGPLGTNPLNPWPVVVASVWLAVFGLLLLPARDPVAKRRVEVPVMGDGGR